MAPGLDGGTGAGTGTYPCAISVISVELAPLRARTTPRASAPSSTWARSWPGGPRWNGKKGATYHGSSLVASRTLASISLTLSTTFLAYRSPHKGRPSSSAITLGLASNEAMEERNTKHGTKTRRGEGKGETQRSKGRGGRGGGKARGRSRARGRTWLYMLLMSYMVRLVIVFPHDSMRSIVGDDCREDERERAGDEEESAWRCERAGALAERPRRFRAATAAVVAAVVGGTCRSPRRRGRGGGRDGRDEGTPGAKRGGLGWSGLLPLRAFFSPGTLSRTSRLLCCTSTYLHARTHARRPTQRRAHDFLFFCFAFLLHFDTRHRRPDR